MKTLLIKGNLIINKLTIVNGGGDKILLYKIRGSPFRCDHDKR